MVLLQYLRLGVAIVVSLAWQPVAGQTAASATKATTARAATAAKRWTPARTADGQPDLQGVRANNSATPLERLKEFAGRALLQIYEYACHEGNTGMMGVLAGARAQEAQEAAKAGSR